MDNDNNSKTQSKRALYNSLDRQSKNLDRDIYWAENNLEADRTPFLEHFADHGQRQNTYVGGLSPDVKEAIGEQVVAQNVIHAELFDKIAATERSLQNEHIHAEMQADSDEIKMNAIRNTDRIIAETLGSLPQDLQNSRNLLEDLYSNTCNSHIELMSLTLLRSDVEGMKDNMDTSDESDNGQPGSSSQDNSGQPGSSSQDNSGQPGSSSQDNSGQPGLGSGSGGNSGQPGSGSQDNSGQPGSDSGSGSQEGGQSSSLIDDFADPSLEQPSYMDPED